MHEQEHPSATYDSGATRRQKVVLISRQGDSARTLAATLCTHADSTTMVVADEAPRGPLVPWHAARIPDWVSLPARIVRGIETAGADRASLAAVVFQSRHATVDSEEDIFVGVLPRPLDARVYTAPVVLALRADVDAGDNIAWLDMDAEACDLMLDSWLAGPLLDADTCATARTEFDADSSAMSTDDERHTNAEVAPPATTTTTDDDDERQGADGGTPAARAALKARRRGRATPTPRRKSRRDRATAVADDDRSSHATDDEDAPAPRRRLRASRRAPRHVAGERDDEGDEDDENNGGGGGLADDVGRGVEEDDDDDVCRDDSDDDLRTAEADDDLGDDDMSDVGDNDDVDDDDGDLDGIGGANGDMDDDLADDEEGDMDDDPNAE
ncbi:TOP2c incomplete domain containing protein [Pandoravirus japonicus]|uniref:TOP2c incomplete domain containing protein n=1 Tax=Pandoravirus japonicus TaxID=2823154 RepID=A0A811BSW1_9VIRU|nr:TOP2c incomplete domain containing protein [Pandoravirus japonicus]